jgi:hypothetical protein
MTIVIETIFDRKRIAGFTVHGTIPQELEAFLDSVTDSLLYLVPKDHNTLRAPTETWNIAHQALFAVALYKALDEPSRNARGAVRTACDQARRYLDARLARLMRQFPDASRAQAIDALLPGYAFFDFKEWPGWP